MVRFMAATYFLHFTVPLISVIISIFVKYVTKNDNYARFRKEDLAIGLELASIALIILVTDCAAAAAIIVQQSAPNISLNHKILTGPWIILLFAFGIWGISTIVRKKGWEDQDNLRLFWGILLPDLYGLLTLLFVVNWIS